MRLPAFILAAAVVQTPSMITTPIPEPEKVAPCPVLSEDQAVPRVTPGRTQPPRLRKQVALQLTDQAREARVDVAVWVALIVDVDGQPCDLHIVRVSPPDLGMEEAGLEAVRQWRFAPATRDGVPVRAPITVHMANGTTTRGSNPRISRSDAKVVDPLLRDSRPRSGGTPPR